MTETRDSAAVGSLFASTESTQAVCGDPPPCPHIKRTVAWGIACDEEWCAVCKRFVQLKVDWKGHP